MLIAPTEPPALRAIGQVSMRTERLGVDIAWVVQSDWWGVQRKEVADFIASMYDGRLSREIAMMKACKQAVLLVEGRLTFTTDGVLLNSGYQKPITRKQIDGFLWSVRSQGIWVDYTTNLQDTIAYVGRLETWTRKEKHTGLVSRPGPTTSWGVADDRDFAIHLLMGLPGVGKELAERILNHFGRLPWVWDVDEIALTEVEGIGAKTASRIWKAVNTQHGDASDRRNLGV